MNYHRRFAVNVSIDPMQLIASFRKCYWLKKYLAYPLNEQAQRIGLSTDHNN